MNLNQVTLPSSDLSVSVPFYQALGLQLIVDSQPRYARFLCPEGNSTFSLHHVAGSSPNLGTLIYFECRELNKKVDNLKQQGIKFDQEPKDQSWLWREARLRDPDGNRICLFWGGENRISPPWRIDPD